MTLEELRKVIKTLASYSYESFLQKSQSVKPNEYRDNKGDNKGISPQNFKLACIALLATISISCMFFMFGNYCVLMLIIAIWVFL